MKTSYSALTQHRECPQRWAYARLARLETVSATETIARDFGTWGHAWLALDAIRRGIKSETIKSYPDAVQLGNGYSLTFKGGDVAGVTATEREFWTLFTHWWKQLSEDDAAAWVEYLGEPAPTRLANIVRGYRSAWGEADKARQVLAVELPWSRELPNGTEIVGVVDLVEIDTRRNVIVVTDHKFKKRTEQSSTDDLLDSQLHLYAWGAAPVVEAWGLGSIQAVAYDRIRSVAGKTPILTATGTLSKSVTDYDLTTYLKWAAGPEGDGVPWGTDGEFYKTGKKAGEPKFGKYTTDPEVVAKLFSESSRSVWFDRTFSPVSTNIMRTHLLSAQYTSEQVPATVARWESEGDAPRNFTYGCRFCDFRDLCAAQLVGGPQGEYPLEDFGLRERLARDTP